MDKENGNVMMVKQKAGGFTRRVTIPAKHVDAIGGRATKKVDCYRLCKGLLYVAGGLKVDPAALKDIDNILDVGSEDHLVTLLKL